MTEILKPAENFSPFKNWRYDVPAAVVVLLVALPLCLGIALASGAPLFSGLIAGAVGGIVVGALSKSPLSVSGPAAGLTVIVLDAIQSLPSYEMFLAAVVLAGVMQLVLGALRAGVIGDFIPSSVITGMLSAIGLILIIKQIPYLVGFDASHFSGDDGHHKGGNTFAHLWEAVQNPTKGALFIGLFSLGFLFLWDAVQPKFKNFLRYIPGPLLAVAMGVAANEIFKLHYADLALGKEFLVAVPVSDSLREFAGNFTFPDFSVIYDYKVWIIAATLAIVASLETLLSIEAIDRIDPFKRVTPTNRELLAQGTGNMISGLLGGIPVTSVIVRSSANMSSGARTKMSTILHGLLLLGCVIAIPQLLNHIPLATLAAVLIAVGYKLAKPKIFYAKYKKGMRHLIPFLATIIAILMTDLLIGIGIGCVFGLAFVLFQNMKSALTVVNDGNNYLIRSKRDLFFVHKYELKRILSSIPADGKVLLDLSRAQFIDLDNVEIIQDFMTRAVYDNINVTVKGAVDE
jgi:MFS superfamily sulfate permease-like transporter